MFIRLCLVPERRAACLPASCASFSSWSWSDSLNLWRQGPVFCPLKMCQQLLCSVARPVAHPHMQTFTVISSHGLHTPPPPTAPTTTQPPVSGNARLQHVAQMDDLRSCSSESSCYGNLLPGGCFFFFFSSRVAVGSQRQSNCMNSEKGEVNMSFPWLGKTGKKDEEVTAALDRNF